MKTVILSTLFLFLASCGTEPEEPNSPCNLLSLFPLSPANTWEYFSKNGELIHDVSALGGFAVNDLSVANFNIPVFSNGFYQRIEDTIWTQSATISSAAFRYTDQGDVVRGSMQYDGEWKFIENSYMSNCDWKESGYYSNWNNEESALSFLKKEDFQFQGKSYQSFLFKGKWVSLDRPNKDTIYQWYISNIGMVRHLELTPGGDTVEDIRLVSYHVE